jgi:hypothetical protein
MKVFISGRVTGLPRQEAERNFQRAEDLIYLNMFEPANPLKIVPADASNKHAMKILLPILCDCDAILLLKDHKFSEGSYIEKKTAQYCGLLFFHEEDLTQKRDGYR